MSGESSLRNSITLCTPLVTMSIPIAPHRCYNWTIHSHFFSANVQWTVCSLVNLIDMHPQNHYFISKSFNLESNHTTNIKKITSWWYLLKMTADVSKWCGFSKEGLSFIARWHDKNRIIGALVVPSFISAWDVPSLAASVSPSNQITFRYSPSEQSLHHIS